MVDKNRLDDPHVKANLLFQVEAAFDINFSFFFLSFSILLSFYWAFPFPNSFIYLPYIFFGRQAHFSQLELPISDYVTDLKSVLDQSIRIIQAMIDICANSGWLSSSITCMRLLQMIMQVSSVPIMMKLWKINLLLFANLSIQF